MSGGGLMPVTPSPRTQLAMLLGSIDTPDVIAVRAALAVLDENHDDAFDMYSYEISELYDALYTADTALREAQACGRRALDAAHAAGLFGVRAA